MMHCQLERTAKLQRSDKFIIRIDVNKQAT